jgi:hypothetical protein
MRRTATREPRLGDSERTNDMKLELSPEPACSGVQIIAHGYSRENGDVVVAFLFKEQAYQVWIGASRRCYPFSSRRAAVSFAAEVCEHEQ